MRLDDKITISYLVVVITFLFDMQVYTGPYKHPRALASQVQKVANHLDALKENVFVAVHLQEYKRVPVIGKVKSVEGNNFEIEYWKGSWCKEWTLWIYNGAVWTNILPKTCILLVDFSLDKNCKLPNEIKKYLQDTYQRLKKN